MTTKKDIDELSKLLKDSPIHKELAGTIEGAAATAAMKVISKTVETFREDAKSHGEIVGLPEYGSEMIAAISISGITLTRSVLDYIGHTIAMVNAACIVHGEGLDPAKFDFGELMKEAAKVIGKHEKENEEMNV